MQVTADHQHEINVHSFKKNSLQGFSVDYTLCQRWVLLMLLASSFLSPLKAETYVYMTSSAESHKLNYKRYFDNLCFAYTALVQAGVKKENITVNYALVGDKNYKPSKYVAFDEARPNKKSVELTLAQLKAPKGYLIPKINGPATDENIVKTFENYSKILKANDHLIVFVAGHYGEAIETWREGIERERDEFPYRRVAQLFEKIPSGVKLIYINHGCFSGEIMDPSSSNYYTWKGKKQCAIWFSDKGKNIEKTPGMEWFWKQVAQKKNFYEIFQGTSNFELPQRQSSYTISQDPAEIEKQKECFDFWKE